MFIELLDWHLYIPFWDWNEDKYIFLKPIDVINIPKNINNSYHNL